MASVVSNPILISVPETFESNRLIIRSPLWGDGAMVNEAVKESMEELRRWMNWAQQIPTIEESEIIARQGRINFLDRSDLKLYLLLKETGQFIGSSGLHRIDWEARKFEIGYWVHTMYSGQGFITEAVESITNYAVNELQANRVEIRCDSRNIRSINVAERSGFTMEGTIRNEKCDIEGKLCDTVLFSKVRGIEFG